MSLGCQQVVGDEKVANGLEMRGNGLWNAQPFQQAPSVDLPSNEAGAARAQPLEVGSPAEGLCACAGVGSDHEQMLA